MPEYGSAQSPFAPGKRKRYNMAAVCVNIFVPSLVFTYLNGLLSFSFHYWRPRTTWLFVAIGLCYALVLGLVARRAQLREEDPKWYTFAFIATLIAVILGTLFGDMNYWYNMQPFYDIETLNEYHNVNPREERGSQLMDAGRVYFSDETHLDVRKAMGFKNLDIYCVVPIVSGSGHLASYDFWAVGINCCSGVSADFRCGEYSNRDARSGLRLMSDSQRPYFRLAVQQAEAAYGIKSAHPLFFYWMQDPVTWMTSYRDDGFKYYLLGVFTHFSLNLAGTVFAVISFSRMG